MRVSKNKEILHHSLITVTPHYFGNTGDKTAYFHLVIYPFTNLIEKKNMEKGQASLKVNFKDLELEYNKQKNDEDGVEEIELEIIEENP